MELFVSWCHLLDNIFSDGVATGNLRKQFGAVRVHVLYDGLLAWLVVYNCGSVVSLQAHGHSEGSGLSLSGVVRVKLFNFDLIFVLVGVVEHEDLHGVLERRWVLEVDGEASLADLVLSLLPSLGKLSAEFLEFSRWRGLSALLGNFVGSTWCLNLEINFLVLILLAILFKDAFIPYFIFVLQLLLFGLKLILLAVEEFLVVLRILLICLLLSLGLATSALF